MRMTNFVKAGYSKAEPVSKSVISRLIGFQKIWILPCAMKNTSMRNSCGRHSKKSLLGDGTIWSQYSRRPTRIRYLRQLPRTPQLPGQNCVPWTGVAYFGRLAQDQARPHRG